MLDFVGLPHQISAKKLSKHYQVVQPPANLNFVIQIPTLYIVHCNHESILLCLMHKIILLIYDYFIDLIARGPPRSCIF